MIEPMLWTRYSAAGGEVKATIHTEGPQAGELVFVSAEAAVEEPLA